MDSKKEEMEILELVRSPRKGGNTGIMVDAIHDQASENAHWVKKSYLYDHRIGLCIDCRACTSGAMTCPILDDMLAMYRAMEQADVLIFGPPVYWWGPTGPMKLLLDRLRHYFPTRRLAGKGAVLAVSAKDGPAEAELLSTRFRRSLEFLEMNVLGEFLGTAADRRDIHLDTQALQGVAGFGANR